MAAPKKVRSPKAKKRSRSSSPEAELLTTAAERGNPTPQSAGALKPCPKKKGAASKDALPIKENTTAAEPSAPHSGYSIDLGGHTAYQTLRKMGALDAQAHSHEYLSSDVAALFTTVQHGGYFDAMMSKLEKLVDPRSTSFDDLVNVDGN
jgi:uncharacterized iron-regulated membrane protein